MQPLGARLLAFGSRLIMAETPADAHLTTDDVAAYVGSRITAAARHRIDRHLAECGDCRAEVYEVRMMVQSAPPARRSRVPVIGVIGAAAAALLLVVTPWNAVRRATTAPSPSVGAERSVVPDAGRDSVQIVAPALDDAVARSNVTFIWRRGANDAQFTVTLLNDRGDIRWSTTTRDSSATVPDSVALSPATTYVLYVDAQRADGTSARSAPRTFAVRE